MSRLLFILAIAAIIYLLLKSYRAGAASTGRSGSSGSSGSPGPSGPAEQRAPEDMVRCVHCGVHLPRSESILSGGKFYCSEAHRQAHQAPPADRNAKP